MCNENDYLDILKMIWIQLSIGRVGVISAPEKTRELLASILLLKCMDKAHDLPIDQTCFQPVQVWRFLKKYCWSGKDISISARRCDY